MRSYGRICLMLALGVAGSWAGFAQPGKQVSESGIRHSFLITGPVMTAIFDENSDIVWRVEGTSRDGYVLDNGNVLVSDGHTAREYAKGTTDVVWQYELAKENQELGTVQRLPNGDTMIVERGPKPRIIEVAEDGTINVDVPLQPETDNGHMQTRMARKRPNGNYLVPHLLAFRVKEYTPTGEVVRVIKTDRPEFGGRDAHCWPFTAIELENGNLLVNLTHSHRTAEFDKNGDVAWYVDNSHVDGRFADPCGAQRMPNGNTVICSYAQKDPEMPRLFEITHSKEVVWEFFHPEARAHEVHVITTNGEKVSPVQR